MLRRGAAYFGLILLFALVLLALPGRASATVSYSAQEIEIVRLINEYRMSYGLDPVLVSDVLSDSAEKHSGDMAKYGFFSHYTAASDWFNVDSRPADRMVACGYPSGTWTGENIAAGYDTPATVMTAWKQSYAHNLNMLDTKWKVIGIGLVDMSGSSMGTYWTTDFGSYLDGSAHENGGTLPPDTTPPTVTITAPAQASEVSGTVTVSVTADDNRAVHHVELYANGVFVARDDASPYAVLWPSSSAPNGECNLEARAYDTSNNMAVATRLVYVSGSSVTTTTTPPSTTTTTTSTTTTSTTATTATTSTTSTRSYEYHEHDCAGRRIRRRARQFPVLPSGHGVERRRHLLRLRGRSLPSGVGDYQESVHQDHRLGARGAYSRGRQRCRSHLCRRTLRRPLLPVRLCGRGLWAGHHHRLQRSHVCSVQEDHQTPTRDDARAGRRR